MSYTVRFCNVNDRHTRYFIVCVDKTWGVSGCQPWTGDWVYTGSTTPGACITSPPFTPTRVLTAVTSSDASYYYAVEFVDSQGRVVKRCDRVDRNNPCYLEVTQPPPTPTPTPTPTRPLPSPSPTPSPTPGPVSDWLIIAILIVLLVVLILALLLLSRKK